MLANNKGLYFALIYKTDGRLILENIKMHNNINIFRKMTNNIIEKKMCKLLMNCPHKNIIKNATFQG